MTLAAIFAALALGITHSPAPPENCAYTVPVIALDRSQIMSGNMRTTDGGCLIWANAAYLPALSRCNVAQLASHEAGHLAGLQHSQNPLSPMFSPFRPLRLSWCSDRSARHHWR